MLKGWVAGLRLRCWERLPQDLGPFSPGSLLEDEAGGDTSESSVKSLEMLKVAIPCCREETRDQLLFKWNGIFRGSQKPFIFRNKIFIICWIEDLDETQILLLSLGWRPKILCSNELPSHPAAAGPQLTLWVVTLEGVYHTKACSFYTRVALMRLATWVPTCSGMGTGWEDAECVKVRGWTGLFINSFNKHIPAFKFARFPQNTLYSLCI